jgi:hypothetical protein
MVSHIDDNMFVQKTFSPQINFNEGSGTVGITHIHGVALIITQIIFIDGLFQNWRLVKNKCLFAVICNSNCCKKLNNITESLAHHNY